MQTCFRIRVYGKVQGVFFRKSAKIEADKLGVLGWVRNEGDRSVEIVAQGQKLGVDKFIVWCRKGPPFAKVDSVEVQLMKKLEDFEEFEVLE